MWHLFLLKNSEIKFTHKKETRPIPNQIFILTRYKKKSPIWFTNHERGERMNSSKAQPPPSARDGDLLLRTSFSNWQPLTYLPPSLAQPLTHLYDWFSAGFPKHVPFSLSFHPKQPWEFELNQKAHIVWWMIS